MIGTQPWTRGWWLAAGLSVGLHGAAGATLIWQPSLAIPDAHPLPELRMDIAPAAAQVGDAEPLQPVSHPGAIPNALAPATLDQVLTPAIPSDQPDLLLSSVLPIAASPQAALDPPTPPGPAAHPDAPPPDPRIADLFDRIRSRLTEPCLLALPALLAEDRIQLAVMAASDRQIADLMRALTDGFPAEIVERAALLDRRQCAGLDFARRDPGYPLPGLSLQLDAQDVASGGDISGRVSGGTGLYTTLLLIDDNGVVHDMRRFLVGSATSARFRVPVARMGQMRDTYQVLLAMATPERPDAVSRHAGETAAEFFAALGQEVGTGLRIGVATIYVR